MAEQVIQAPMGGKELDRILKAINDASDPKNNGKICYIRRGTTAFENWEDFSEIVKL